MRSRVIGREPGPVRTRSPSVLPIKQPLRHLHTLGVGRLGLFPNTSPFLFSLPTYPLAPMISVYCLLNLLGSLTQWMASSMGKMCRKQTMERLICRTRIPLVSSSARYESHSLWNFKNYTSINKVPWKDKTLSKTKSWLATEGRNRTDSQVEIHRIWSENWMHAHPNSICGATPILNLCYLFSSVRNVTAVLSATWRVIEGTNEVIFMKIPGKPQQVINSSWRLSTEVVWRTHCTLGRAAGEGHGEGHWPVDGKEEEGAKRAKKGLKRHQKEAQGSEVDSATWHSSPGQLPTGAALFPKHGNGSLPY